MPSFSSCPSTFPFPPLPSTLPTQSLSHSNPTTRNFSAPHLCIGGGVAIFHLATARVVLCYHSRDKYYFLPKGRRDVNEDSTTGAEREGFEESGYRNRVLPLPMRHIQPMPHLEAFDSESGGEYDAARVIAGGRKKVLYATEPVLTQLVPVGVESKQYMLHWYVAETLPPDVEREVESEMEERRQKGIGGYVRPRQWGPEETLKGRIEQDWLKGPDDVGAVEGDSETSGQQQKERKDIYEPIKHEGTGVDAEEALYVSSLIPVEEAIEKLQWTGQDFVVRVGWEGIIKRWHMEDAQ